MLRSRTTSSVSLPKPLAAGLGLASRAPHALTELGLRLPSIAFSAVHEARARYDEYARVGAELLSKADADEASNVSLFALQDDEDESEYDEESGAGFAAAPFDTAPSDTAPSDTAPSETDLLDDTDHEPAGFAPTPAAESPGAQALATAAEDRTHQPEVVPLAVDLPIENYDGLSLPQVRARLSRLDLAQVEQLRDYESAHGRRLPILTMLENRLSKLTDQA
jgi:hypothetical protein